MDLKKTLQKILSLTLFLHGSWVFAEALKAPASVSAITTSSQDNFGDFFKGVSDWNPHGGARIFGLGVSDQTEESRVSGLQLSGEVQRKFNSYFDLGAGLRARFETGTTHSLYEVNRVANGIWLDEARMNVHLLPETLTVSLGAINQRFLQNPLLLTELSFPAVQEKLEWGNKSSEFQSDFSMALVAQQAIPTSMSLSTRSAAKEDLPSLFTENLFLKAHPEGSLWAFHGNVGAFAFYDLPTSVAYDSRAQGNLAEGDFPENTRFQYDFRGYTYGADVGVPFLFHQQVQIGFAGLTNAVAPRPYRDGRTLFVQAEKCPAFGNWSWTPRWEYFRNERHSSPAYYNSSDYGHNNRHGFAYELKIENPHLGVAVKARYTDARLIEEEPSQASTQILMIYLDVL